MRIAKCFLMLALVYATMLESCTKPHNVDEIPEIEFNEAPADFKLTDSFSKFKFIQLEQTDDAVFDYVVRIVDAGECLLVQAMFNELYCYNKNDGSFRCRIGKIGEGPGEILVLSGFFFNSQSNTVGVLDRLKKAKLYYELKGNFLYKDKVEINNLFVSGMAQSPDGYIMIANKIDDTLHDNFAYTVIRPDGSLFSFDSFGPVKTGGEVAAVAYHPMSSYDGGFTFRKFFNDTIFRMEDGSIFPLYMLKIKKLFPSKEMVSQLGPYKQGKIIEWCHGTGYFSGIDDIYETDRYILVEPSSTSLEGYFWIDKETGSGIRIASTNRLEHEFKNFIEGRTIGFIKGGNEHGIISCLQPILLRLAAKILEDNPDILPFDDKLIPFFKNADPEGNPLVIIYEH